MSENGGWTPERRALWWIRFRADMHWSGRAFEPVHMRDLAQLADDALELGEAPAVPDIEAVLRESKELARYFGQVVQVQTDGEVDEPVMWPDPGATS